MLPAGYDAGARRYPVLYMLHGVAGDSSEWQSIGLLDAADRMIMRGEIDPFLIVLPNGGANYWVNQADGARWADYVVDDVVRQVDRDYRTVAAPRGRAIGGLSMGGEGALRIAMTRPGRLRHGGGAQPVAPDRVRRVQPGRSRTCSATRTPGAPRRRSGW